MRVAIVNIGLILTGDWREPFAAGDIVVCDDGIITSVGTAPVAAIEGADIVIDADGTTLIPGLIDSHVHITFGDYTPRQQTVGYLESYIHGGTTTAISASEVHVPGRPRDPDGVKALAVSARKCFESYRPGGMTVHAGSKVTLRIYGVRGSGWPRPDLARYRVRLTMCLWLPRPAPAE
jgi:enamidase